MDKQKRKEISVRKAELFRLFSRNVFANNDLAVLLSDDVGKYIWRIGLVAEFSIERACNARAHKRKRYLPAGKHLRRDMRIRGVPRRHYFFPLTRLAVGSIFPSFTSSW